MFSPSISLMLQCKLTGIDCISPCPIFFCHTSIFIYQIDSINKNLSEDVCSQNETCHYNFPSCHSLPPPPIYTRYFIQFKDLHSKFFNSEMILTIFLSRYQFLKHWFWLIFLTDFFFYNYIGNKNRFPVFVWFFKI